MPIYSEVHPEKNYNTPFTHESFLENLSNILPKDIKPILVTDAGFRVPWCVVVSSMGWYYVTRVRACNVQLKGESSWLSLQTLSERTSETTCNLGLSTLNKSTKRQFKTNLYLYKKKLVGRKDIGKCGQVIRGKESRIQAKSAREPWLISTNLPSEGLPKEINPIWIYKKRMQIEETFRDLKSERFGFSLNFARSSCDVVWSNLLLIGSIALFVLYTIGKYAENQSYHYYFQANTIKNRRVLSLVFLGRQILQRASETTKTVLDSIFNELVDRVWVEITCAK